MAGGGGGGGGVSVGWRWGSPNYRLSVIADTGIKFIADIDEDIFCVGSLWYRFSGGVWFSCSTYGGSWVRIDAPPAVFTRIPPGHAKYRVVKGRRPGSEEHPGKGHGRGRGRGKNK
jgi:hypothetical protein